MTRTTKRRNSKSFTFGCRGVLAGEYVLLKKYRSYEPSLMLRLAEKHGHEYLERFRPFERLGKMRFPSLLPLGALAEPKAISVFEDGAAEDIIEQHPNVPLGVITVVEGLTGSGRGVTRLLDISRTEGSTSETVWEPCED